MLGSSKSYLLVCLLSVYLSGLVNGIPIAAPQPNAVEFAARSTPTTVQTTQMVETATGTMMETCTITLTPDSTGTVQEVKSCTLTPVSSAAAGTVATSATASAPAVVSEPAAAASATGSPTIVVVGESSIASSLVFPTSATAAAVASASVTGTATAGGALATGSAADSSPTPVDNAAGAGTQTAAASSAPASSTVTPKAQVAAAVTFSIPGRHILILPVGLIIYCVLTGITILVVLFMIVERMRYRRVFRQRRLAEQGAAMGYGGMGKV